MTRYGLETIDTAALARISGGGDENPWALCSAFDSAQAAKMIADGSCTAVVRTPGGTNIAVPRRTLNQAFMRQNATELLASPEE